MIDALKISEGTDPVHGSTTTFGDVVIASEIIHEYGDGKAYKPADELENAYWSWEGRWAMSHDHPAEGIIMTLDNIHGKTVNLRFVKNLKDHKTDRPNRRGILADLVVFNKRVPSQTLEDMKNGKRPAVSIGFFFTKDATAGVIEEDGHPLKGQNYDYVQRAFMGEHTAFALEAGRCPMPNCGIGADKLIPPKEVEGDPFAGYAGMTECIKDLMKPKSEGGQGYTKEQAAGTCAEIEKKSKAKHKKDESEDKDSDLMSASAQDMTLEEIDEKIAELRAKRDAIRKQINALYEKQRRKKDPFEDKVDKLYEDMRGFEDEIRAYRAAKVLKITTAATSDHLVEEEYQGNVPAVGSGSESERAKMFFNMSDEEWEALTDEEKKGYIAKLPPKKSKDMNCIKNWEELREKIWDGESLDAADFQKFRTLLGELTFEEDKVRMTQDTFDQLVALLKLEDCECDKEDDTPEDDDYDELIKPHLAADAVLSYAQKKALPDSAYAYIEAGCKKEDGKTQQKCRHMPIHDEAHVRAALAALKGARTGQVPSYASKAKGKVCAAAKKFKIKSEVCGTADKDVTTEELLQDAKRVWKDRKYIIG